MVTQLPQGAPTVSLPLVPGASRLSVVQNLLCFLTPYQITSSRFSPAVVKVNVEDIEHRQGARACQAPARV